MHFYKAVFLQAAIKLYIKYIKFWFRWDMFLDILVSLVILNHSAALFLFLFHVSIGRVWQAGQTPARIVRQLELFTRMEVSVNKLKPTIYTTTPNLPTFSSFGTLRYTPPLLNPLMHRNWHNTLRPHFLHWKVINLYSLNWNIFQTKNCNCQGKMAWRCQTTSNFLYHYDSLALLPYWLLLSNIFPS